MDNFLGNIQSAGPGFDSGWTSSNAPHIFQFLQSQSRNTDTFLTLDELAVEALKVAAGQGASHYYTEPDDDPRGFDRPWRRAFTYGDLQQDAEWLAAINLDVDLTEISCTGYKRHWGFRRVLVGAPFWIRTPTPQALRLYSQQPPERLPPLRSRRRRRFLVSGRHVRGSL